MSLVVNSSRIPGPSPFHFGVAPVVPKASSLSFNADPTAVAKNKEEAAKTLEKQLKGEADKLGVNMKTQVDELHKQATQEKALHSLLVDQQVKQQELLLSQQYNQQLMLLTQAAQRQGAELEQQATNLMLDYQQRKVEEDFYASQAGVEKQFGEMQQKFIDELAKSNVYPMPPAQAPRLGAGIGMPGMPNLGVGNLPPGFAPAMLPNMLGGGQGKGLPYVVPGGVQQAPPSSYGGTTRASSVGPSCIRGSVGSVRAPLPGSFQPGSMTVPQAGGYMVPMSGPSSFSSAQKVQTISAPTSRMPQLSGVPRVMPRQLGAV